MYDEIAAVRRYWFTFHGFATKINSIFSLLWKSVNSNPHDLDHTEYALMQYLIANVILDHGVYILFVLTKYNDQPEIVNYSFKNVSSTQCNIQKTFRHKVLDDKCREFKCRPFYYGTEVVRRSLYLASRTSLLCFLKTSVAKVNRKMWVAVSKGKKSSRQRAHSSSAWKIQ